MKTTFFLRITLAFFLNLLIFSVLILSPVIIQAQSEPKTEDVIYLKDGGILRGKIFDVNNDGVLKIETAGRNVFVVQMTEVARITEELLPVSRYYKTSGYINNSGFDLLAGRDKTTPYFYTMNGYQFSPQLAAGIGIGYIPYRDPLDLLPVYLQVNINLREANTTPFLFLKTGYNFTVTSGPDNLIESHQGGWMLNPGIGIQFYLSEGFGMYIDMAYNVNNAGYEEEGFQGATIENDLTYKRVMFGLGFSF